MSDDTLIDIALRAKNGERFRKLFYGEISDVCANLIIGQLAHRKVGQYQYNYNEKEKQIHNI
jgi:hypothetical protein